MYHKSLQSGVWGIKAFTLVDAANDYLLNSMVYTGAQTLKNANPAYQTFPQPGRIVMEPYLRKVIHPST